MTVTSGIRSVPTSVPFVFPTVSIIMAAVKHVWQQEVCEVNPDKSNGFLRSYLHVSTEKNMKQVWKCKTQNSDLLCDDLSMCALNLGYSEVQFSGTVVVVEASSPILLF